ncbi:MAG: acetate kinase [Thermosediminibacterales bacterium]|nr:acetate kinase [Thermosediminibacterales bacterium]MDK2835447.1 acetate kinase [Thermosediminibacterales bacterium]
MKVLVINCGSSSLKYKLFNMEDESVLANGLVERIKLEGSVLKHEPLGKEKVEISTEIPDHEVAIKMMLDALTHPDYGVIKDLNEISAVGHRIVHGGEKFTGSVKITDEVIKSLEECIELAPLHNPPNILGIEAVKKQIPGVPMVGVFDTAFHQTIPQKAFMYGLPYEYYKNKGLRRYGFHGTSHQYVSQRAAEILKKPIKELKIVTCHLGNGVSLTAVKGGKSVDTTLGFGTVSGVIMGTRCGDVDPVLITYLMEKENLNYEQINDILHKKSGLLGISGVSSDMRDIEEAAEKGNKRAQLALEMFEYMVIKYIGAYAAAMNGLDAVVFTAGIGENAIQLRKNVCEGLKFLGIEIDDEKNNARGKEIDISKQNSKVRVLVIPTNEELMIARETKALVY